MQATEIESESFKVRYATYKTIFILGFHFIHVFKSY